MRFAYWRLCRQYGFAAGLFASEYARLFILRSKSPDFNFAQKILY